MCINKYMYMSLKKMYIVTYYTYCILHLAFFQVKNIFKVIPYAHMEDLLTLIFPIPTQYSTVWMYHHVISYLLIGGPFCTINNVAVSKLGHASLCMFANISEYKLLDMELLGQVMAGVVGAWPRYLLWYWCTHSLAAAKSSHLLYFLGNCCWVTVTV